MDVNHLSTTAFTMAGSTVQRIKLFIAELLGSKSDKATQGTTEVKKSKETWVNGRLVEQ